MFNIPSLLVLILSIVQPHNGNSFQIRNAYSRIPGRRTDHQLECVSSTAKSIESANAVEGLLLEFDRQLKHEEYDAQVTSRLHMDAILTLVKSDVQDRDIDDGSESHPFPQSYLRALTFIISQTSSLKEKNSPLFTSANMISKKEGIAQVLKSIKSVNKQLMSSREIVEVKRKTERVLSQLMTLFIAYNSCLLAGTEKDLLFFTKALLEKTPIHDRHFALLLFSRGLLAPPYFIGSNSYSSLRGNSEQFGDLAEIVRLPVLSLSQSFKKNMASLGIAQPSISARMLYPFASAAMRAFSAGNSKTSTVKQKNDDWFSNDLSDTGVSGTQAQQGSHWGIFHDADLKLCLLLQACMAEDTNAEQSREMTGSGDEVLSTLRRWICDLAATHFMNDEEGLFSTRDSLPEEVKKNTVAMELLCTERAFCDGKKRDRTRFLALFAEVGNYLEVMSSLRDAKGDQATANGVSSLPHAKFTFRVKKTIAAISATKFLPRTHKLRVGMENGGTSSFLGAYNANRKSKISTATRSLSSAGSASAESADDGMWADVRPAARVGIIRPKIPPKRAADAEDDDMWAAASPKELEKQRKKKAAEAAAPVAKEFDLVPQVDEYLLQILAEVLKVDEATVRQQHVKDEVDYVFSTWRRPHLLLDYYRMHSSTPEIQNNFRRFLSALFGVSGETVEGIRYADPGNKRHLDLLPPELSARWIEGVARTGEILPGYCDPQTLFMLGEDSNTCMGVRARQKGSNRGLPSMLLHGNCRVLGAKDSHGRLTARAVSRLLVDDVTGLPVLYVETPYGSVDEASYVAVYDQAAELGGLLRIPVIYASPPSPSLYVMGSNELPAVTVGRGVSEESQRRHGHQAADWMIEEDDEEEEEELQSSEVTVEDSREKIVLSKLLDFTEMASHVWIDGIRDPVTGRYLSGKTPFLFITKRALVGENGKEEDSLTMGGRPPGALENMLAKGMQLQPPIIRTVIEKKEKVADVFVSQYLSPIIPSVVSTNPAAAVSWSPDAPADDALDVDEDDFFGIASTLTAYKRRPQKPSVQAQAQTQPAVRAVPNAPELLDSPVAQVAAEILTAEEIADKRKSKKQRVVSVQARLAERQRLLSELQQRRQNVISASSREKEEQINEYKSRNSPPGASPDTGAASPYRDDSYSAGRGGTDREVPSQPGVIQTPNAGGALRAKQPPVIVKEEVMEVVDEDDDDSDGLWA